VPWALTKMRSSTAERLQFGKPIGSFQMVQDLLAKMLANITASQCLLVRMSQLEAEGKMTDAHASLAKAFHYRQMSRDCRVGTRASRRQRHRAEYNVGRFFVMRKLSTPTRARSKCRI